MYVNANRTDLLTFIGGQCCMSAPLGCVSKLAPQATSAMQPERDGPGNMPDEGGSSLGTGCTSTTTMGRDD